MDTVYPLKTWQKALSVVMAALMAATVWTAAPAPAYAVTGESGSNLTYDTAVGVFAGEYAMMATRTTSTTAAGAPSIQTNQAIVRANGTKTINSQKHVGAGTGTDSTTQIAGILGTTNPVVSMTNTGGFFGVAALGGSTLVPVQYVAVAYDEAGGKFYAVRQSGSNVILDVYTVAGSRVQEITVGAGTVTNVQAFPGYVQVIEQVSSMINLGGVEVPGGLVNAAKVYAITSSGLKAQSDIVMANANDDSGTAFVKTNGTVWYQPAGGSARQIADGANTSARIEFLQANYAKVMYPQGNGTAYTTSAGVDLSKFTRGGEGVISAMANRVIVHNGNTPLLGTASTTVDQSNHITNVVATLNGSEFLWEDQVIVGYTPQGTTGACQFWVYSADSGKLLQGPVSSTTQVALERQGSNYAITYTPASGSQQFAGFYYDSSLNLISSSSAPSRLGGTLPNGQTIQVTEGTNGTASGYQVTDVNGNSITCGSYTLALGSVQGAETMGLGDATPRVQHGNDNLYCAQDVYGNYGAVDASGNVYVPFVYDNYYDMGYMGAAAPLNSAKYVMVHRDGQWFFFDVADAKEIPAPTHSTPVTVTPHNPAVTPATPAASTPTNSAATSTQPATSAPAFVRTSLADAKISIGNRVYRGKRLYPTRITVKVHGRTLVQDWDYTVSTWGGTKVGRHEVVIYGIGRYSGVAYGSFKIVPKGTKIKHLYRRDRAFVVKWSKQTKQTDGYQIRYSTDKHFKKGVHYKTIKGKKRTAYKVRHLKAHKKYYVQVRTWKKVSGHKYYSSWSKTRSVRTR